MSELQWKPLTLAERGLVSGVFQHCQPGISEYTFTNLFMWSGPRRLEWAAWNEGLFFRGLYHDQPFFYPPVGFNDCHAAFEKLFEAGQETGIRKIRLIPEYQKKFVKHPGAHIAADHDNFDYIYKAESLRTLKGWRLDGKRGFIRKFETQYQWEFSPYRQSYQDACCELFQSWLSARMESDPTARSEEEAFMAMLRHSEELGVSGGLIFVEGRLAGMSFGEKLNETTFVTHYEKADPAYTGSYQMINREFARHVVPGEFLFINREQDMGIPGIRKAKQSYAPIRLLKKYTVTF